MREQCPTLWSILIVPFLMIGCVYPIHRITLAPELPPTPFKLGAGSTVHVVVIDERQTRLLGFSNDFHQVRSESPATVLHGALEQGLSNLGFAVAAASDLPGTTLVIRLRRFDMTRPVFSQAKYRDLFQMVGFRATTLVLRKGTTVFRRTFESELRDEAIKLSLLASDQRRAFNVLLTDLLAMILGDPELLRSLTGGPEAALGPREGLSETVNLSIPSLLVTEDEPAVEVPEQIRKDFADWLHQLLPVPGALRHDLRITYRVVDYYRGIFDSSRDGFLVESTFFDGAGRILGSHRAGHTDDLCIFSGCDSFTKLLVGRAEQVAGYVRGHFLKPD
jgi:hypothetical protein